MKPDRQNLDKIKERKRQFELAMKGDVEMLIKLGIKYLGQTDNGIKVKNEPR